MRAFMQRVLAVAVKEVRQLRRDRLTFGMVIGIPVIQLTLFGYAINQDVRHLGAAVADLAGTQRSRALVADAVASQVLEVERVVGSAKELEDLLREGRVAVGILIPRDFERRIERGGRPAAQLLVDASDPATLGAARGLAGLPVLRPRAPEPGAAPTFEVRAFYNPERRSAVQIVPGLVGVILTMTMVLFTSVAIVRERERGNLELLITTPVRTVELMVGKLLPYVLIGLVQVTLVLTLGFLVFDVPIRGDLGQVYAASFVFILASLALGLLISTLARTQFQAFQLTFFSFLPQILLSGFMFPFDAMPQVARWLAETMPLTHFLRVIRGIVLRGATLPELQRDLWPLAAFAVLMLLAALARFRKRLD